MSARLSEGRARLFVMDGHGSHLTMEIIEYCLTNNIHLMCFPAHLTHMVQPLDVGIFGPVQRAYDKKTREWIRNPANGRMSLAAFFLLYHQAREETISNKLVASAFRGTGLIPIDSEQVLRKLPSAPPLSISQPSLSDPSQAINPFQPPATPRNDRTVGNLLLAARNPLNGTHRQLQTLIQTAVKGAQAAIADRDMLMEELKQLRIANLNKPEEAEDVRMRRYGEELTADDVVRMRREGLEQKQREQAAKEERRIERERRAEERKIEEIEKEQRRIAREAERARKAEEKRLEDLERQRRALERQLAMKEKKLIEEERKIQQEREKMAKEERRIEEEAQLLANKQLRLDLQASKQQQTKSRKQRVTSLQKGHQKSDASKSSVCVPAAISITDEDPKILNCNTRNCKTSTPPPSRSQRVTRKRVVAAPTKLIEQIVGSVSKSDDPPGPASKVSSSTGRPSRTIRPPYWKTQDIGSGK